MHWYAVRLRKARCHSMSKTWNLSTHIEPSKHVCSRWITAILSITGFCGLSSIECQAAATLTYYSDSRSYNTFSLFAAQRALPGGIDLWSFADLHGDQDSGSDRFDLSRYFVEFRLRTPISTDGLFKGLGMEVEYNDLNGRGNSLLRPGLTYRHPVTAAGKSWLQWRVHPFESDGSGWQASVIHSLALGSRLRLAGFTDLNLLENVSNRWVTESQLNFLLDEAFDLVAEGRFNGFEDANPGARWMGARLGLGTEVMRLKSSVAGMYTPVSALLRDRHAAVACGQVMI